MVRLIALLIVLAFAMTTPVLAQPKPEPAVKSDKAPATQGTYDKIKDQIVAKQQ